MLAGFMKALYSLLQSCKHLTSERIFGVPRRYKGVLTSGALDVENFLEY